MSAGMESAMSAHLPKGSSVFSIPNFRLNGGKRNCKLAHLSENNLLNTCVFNIVTCGGQKTAKQLQGYCFVPFVCFVFVFLHVCLLDRTVISSASVQSQIPCSKASLLFF